MLYPLWDAQRGVDGVTTSPASSLGELSTAEGESRIWWIATDGSVQTAVQPKSLATWSVSIVAGPSSAATDSNITAALLSRSPSLPPPSLSAETASLEEKEIRVWWFGPEGQVVCARTTMDEGEGKNNSALWTCFEQLPEKTARESGRKAVVSRTADSGMTTWLWLIRRDNLVYRYKSDLSM
ncbi:MAG: hypothetical protein M1837_005643 [Sclerophora amabilis]|nr:MAG: hypothetical protein M1837_005643 [Sclerophora amabilis]